MIKVISGSELNTNLQTKQKVLKRTNVECNAVSVANSGTIGGGYYAKLIPDYSNINGTILDTSLVMFGSDATMTGTLAIGTLLSSLTKDGAKITGIGVTVNAVVTIRATVNVLYYE